MTSPTKQPFRVVVLFSGRASNFRALAARFSGAERGIRIVGSVTDNGDADGVSIASQCGVPCLVVSRDKELTKSDWTSSLTAAVESFAPDLIVLAGFMRILESQFIEQFADRIINIHPSLLPSFRGSRAVDQSLLAGVRISGCTVHYVVPEVDAGPILAQGAVPVFPNDTVESLAKRILKVEHELLPHVVEMIARREVRYALTKDGPTALFSDSARLATGDQTLMSIQKR